MTERVRDVFESLALASVSVTVLLSMTAAAAAMLKRSTAAMRSFTWTSGVASAAVAPFVALALSLTPAAALGRQAGAAAAVAGVHGAVADALEVADATTSSWQVGVLWLWALGAAFMLQRLVRSHLSAYALVRGSTPAQSAELLEAFGDAALAVGSVVRGPPLECARVSTPMTVGLFRPRVLVPRPAPPWTRDEMRAVLVHELAHAARLDALRQLAAELVRCLHWWNPLAWLAADRLRAERELACDDIVLASGARASLYADVLLRLARVAHGSAAPPASAACATDDVGLALRIARIVSSSERPPARMTARARTLGMSIASLATISIAAVAHPAERSRDHDVGALVDRAAGDMNTCLTEAERDSEVANALIVHWFVGETGTMDESCFTRDDFDNAATRSCIRARLENARFDDALRGRTVVLALPAGTARVLESGDIIDDGRHDVPRYLQRP